MTINTESISIHKNSVRVYCDVFVLMYLCVGVVCGVCTHKGL